MSVTPLRNIFCVIDPTTNNQRALTRAASVAATSGARIHAYLCCAPGKERAQDRDEYRAAELRRHELWLAQLVQPHLDAGLNISTEVECQEHWRAAIVSAARRSEADLIVRSSFRRTALQRRMLKTTDWTLLREAHCPVLLVKTERVGALENVLLALNLAATDDAHQQLTDTLIQYGKGVARFTGADLHAVNAYQGSVNFIHPPDLAKRLGIDRSRAHVGDGTPDEQIARVVEKLGAPLVVIGSIARKGVSGLVVGNTAERILDGIPADVLVVMQH